MRAYAIMEALLDRSAAAAPKEQNSFVFTGT